jgi:hypothetical protein
MDLMMKVNNLQSNFFSKKTKINIIFIKIQIKSVEDLFFIRIKTDKIDNLYPYICQTKSLKYLI